MGRSDGTALLFLQFSYPVYGLAQVTNQTHVSQASLVRRMALEFQAQARRLKLSGMVLRAPTNQTAPKASG